LALAAGSKLGPYEVLAPIGAGGMGEVYRARDPRLNRDVAIKVLPGELAQDPERLARLRREAHLLASLNHPGIAAIYELDVSEGNPFLVLELVEGEGLDERLTRGPVPMDESLAIARQIAEALEEAHEEGIVHRDLKPANVKVTPEGKVKLLDLGLAKAYSGDGATADSRAAHLSHSPTITRVGTEAGLLLGTAAYMSPEQARGKPLDKRADIWAFGVVLFEMLSGRRLFQGETTSDILAAVLKTDPDWSQLPDGTPLRLVRLLMQCLKREPRERLRDIGDGRIEIDRVISEPEEGRAAAPASFLQPRGRRGPGWIIGALILGITVGLSWNMARLAPPAPQSARLVIQLPPEAPLALGTDRPALALSPDGSRLVYVADRRGRRMLYARRLDEFDVRLIAGTEGASGPFFSPDSQWVAFFVDTLLNKVPYEGGAVVTLAEASPVTRGASWGPDDIITFTSNPNGSFIRQSATRANAAPLNEDPLPGPGERSHAWPEVLPDGRTALFALDLGGSFDDARVAAMNLDSRQTKVLLEGGTNPHYSPTGHLLFTRAGALLAVPFERQGLAVQGRPVRVVEGVRTESTGAAHVAVSQTGVLAYVSGGAESSERTLVWVDGQGVEKPFFRPGAFLFPALSPDGRHLALTIEDGSNTDVWVLDIQRDTLVRLTFHPDEDFGPVWSPDGQRIAFASEMLPGGPNLAWVAANGSGSPELLLTDKRGPREWNNPSSWSPDGRVLAFDADRPSLRQDVVLLPLDGERKAHPLLSTRFRERGAVFSPDGRWLAWVSDESGRDEIYLRPYPQPGEKLRLSNDGGSEPLWARDGKELFYRNGDRVMAVAFNPKLAAPVTQPRTLFEKRFQSTSSKYGPRDYDLAPDGRFVMVKPSPDAPPTQIQVVMNWFEELKRRVPRQPAEP
jgi:eukaryotic-like serine/threonine-protein kinase